MSQKSATPTIRDLRPFVICTPENFENTKSFYTAIGFHTLWDDGDSACEFATGFGSQRFLVTLHHGIEPPKNAMLQFWVESAQAWYEHLKTLQVEVRFPGVVIAPPVITPWGWLITYVADPCGQKLHFAEPYLDEVKEFFGNAPWMAQQAIALRT